jgi:hypothetical protein
MDDFFPRILGGVIASVDWIVVFTFIAFATLYFLAPIAGYAAERRGMLLISLYLLLGYGLLVFLQLLIQYILYLSESSGGRGAAHLAFIFAILRLLLFLS